MSALPATLLIGLAAFRVWWLIAEDDITEPIRRRLERWPKIIDPLVCPWCSGSWLTFAITAAAWATMGLEAPILVGVAAAALVPILDLIVQRLSG